MATTNILALPTELIASIVTYLPPQDVFATRLANKQLERASLADFGHRFFRKKGYMLTSASLSTLQEIAGHPELRKYVQHVWFNPDLFTFVRPECAPDPQETPEPGNPDSLLDTLSPRDRKKFVAYRECMQDHSRLMANSAADLTLLFRDTFAKLPKLEVVGMRRSEDHSPWGLHVLTEAVGEDPRVIGRIPNRPGKALSGSTRLFIALINAAAAANVQLRRLYTDVIEIDNIKPEVLTQATLDKACASIWYLETNVIDGWLRETPNPDYTWIDPEDGTGAKDGDGLVRLLKASSSLKELSLQVANDFYRSNDDGLFRPGHLRNLGSKAYSSDCLDNVAMNVQIRGLTRLKLEGLSGRTADLLALLAQNQQSLRSIKLSGIYLTDVANDQENHWPWKIVLEVLRDRCPELEYLLLHHLSTSGGVGVLQEHPVVMQVYDPSVEQYFDVYEHIPIEVHGKAAVQAALHDIIGRPIPMDKESTYTRMDEEVWHTDTSDEEW